YVRVVFPEKSVFTSPIDTFVARRYSLNWIKFALPLNTAVEIDKLEETIQKTLLNHPYLTGEEDLHLKVVEIGKDYVKYKMEMHATSSSSRLHRQLENEVLREVLKFERTSKEI